MVELENYIINNSILNLPVYIYIKIKCVIKILISIYQYFNRN